jgi:thymidylate kinase
MRPLLIAIEGIDACGKSLQQARLADAVGASKMKFPNYGTPTGALILKLLKGERELHTPAEVEGRFGAAQECAAPDEREQALVLQSLMTVNRYEVTSFMTGTLNERALVLDRYFASGLVYGEADGLPPPWLYAVHHCLPKPDLYILLDISVEESFRRRPVREDAYEANRDRLEAARLGYLDLWSRAPEMISWQGNPVRWVQANGMLDPDLLHAGLMHQAEYTAEMMTADVGR